METQIQSVEDSLIEGLSFRLPNSANFITNRRSVQFIPTGGNEFSPNGVRQIKLHLAGMAGSVDGSRSVSTEEHGPTSPSHLVELSSCQLFQTVKNSSGWPSHRRYRLLQSSLQHGAHAFPFRTKIE